MNINIKKNLMIVIISMFAIFIAAHAQEKEKTTASLAALSSVKFFKQTFQCIGCDLSSVNLSYYDPASLIHTPNSQKNCVMDISLSGANLANIEMNKAKFIACRRSGTATPFRKIDFSNVNLNNAILSHAIFYGVSFEGADLSNAKLDHAKMSLSNFSRANFSKSDLRYAQSKRDAMQGWGANFYQANFTDADLSDATLYGFYQGADFSRANLKNTILNATVDSIPAGRSNMKSTELWKDVNFTDANLEDAYLLSDDSATELDLEKAKPADLSQAIFCRTKMPDGKLNNKDCR